MDFNTLWIGDLVFVKSLSRNGKWEGFASNKNAFINIDHTKLEIPLSDLAEAKEEEKTKDWNFDEPEKEKKISSEKEIDLHIDVLNPSLQNQAPEMILNHQLKRCEEFITNSIERRLHRILIIHGKGTGALKTEVYNLIASFENIRFSIPQNNGGAVELWFQY